MFSYTDRAMRQGSLSTDGDESASYRGSSANGGGGGGGSSGGGGDGGGGILRFKKKSLAHGSQHGGTCGPPCVCVFVYICAMTWMI